MIHRLLFSSGKLLAVEVIERAKNHSTIIAIEAIRKQREFVDDHFVVAEATKRYKLPAFVFVEAI